MEKFKEYEELLKPDIRTNMFVQVDRKTGETSDFTLKDVYDEIEFVKLDEFYVNNKDVISQFNVAKNLAIYTWFSYSFHQIAEMKAYSVVEMALRDIFNNYKMSLNHLIKRAVKEKLLINDEFLHLKNSDYYGSFVDNLPLIISKFRNSLAHGSTMLDNESLQTMHICKDIINQLYKNSNTKELKVKS